MEEAGRPSLPAPGGGLLCSLMPSRTLHGAAPLSHDTLRRRMGEAGRLPQFSGDRPSARSEDIARLSAVPNGGGRHVWTYGVERTERTIPHLSPRCARPEEKIPFAGRAPGGVACLRLGRKFIGAQSTYRTPPAPGARLTTGHDNCHCWAVTSEQQLRRRRASRPGTRAPTLRTSTWSTHGGKLTEAVDVPVRHLVTHAEKTEAAAGSSRRAWRRVGSGTGIQECLNNFEVEGQVFRPHASSRRQSAPMRRVEYGGRKGRSAARRRQRGTRLGPCTITRSPMTWSRSHDHHRSPHNLPGSEAGGLVTPSHVPLPDGAAPEDRRAFGQREQRQASGVDSPLGALRSIAPEWSADPSE